MQLIGVRLLKGELERVQASGVSCQVAFSDLQVSYIAWARLSRLGLSK